MMNLIRLSGWLSTIFMLLILAKFPAKRLGPKSANAFFMKHHRHFYYACALISAAHGVLALVEKNIFSATSIMTGVMCFLLALVASFSLRLMKNAQPPQHGPQAKSKPWLVHHRFFAASALLFLIVHVVIQVHSNPLADPAFYAGFRHGFSVHSF